MRHEQENMFTLVCFTFTTPTDAAWLQLFAPSWISGPQINQYSQRDTRVTSTARQCTASHSGHLHFCRRPRRPSHKRTTSEPLGTFPYAFLQISPRTRAPMLSQDSRLFPRPFQTPLTKFPGRPSWANARGACPNWHGGRERIAYVRCCLARRERASRKKSIGIFTPLYVRRVGRCPALNSREEPTWARTHARNLACVVLEPQCVCLCSEPVLARADAVIVPHGLDGAERRHGGVLHIGEVRVAEK